MGLKVKAILKMHLRFFVHSQTLLLEYPDETGPLMVCKHQLML
jgi:hypothetical protein